MQYQDDNLCFSPSGLANFNRSSSSSWMDRWVTEDLSIKAVRDKPSPRLPFLSDNACEHDDLFLDLLKRQYQDLTNVDVDNTNKEMQTRAILPAMHAGVDVTIQFCCYAEVKVSFFNEFIPVKNLEQYRCK